MDNCAVKDKYNCKRQLKCNDNDKECQNIRIYSIMNYLNLQHLVISEKDFVETDISRIYYNTVNDLLEELRSSSRTFLNEVLFNEQ